MPPVNEYYNLKTIAVNSLPFQAIKIKDVVDIDRHSPNMTPTLSKLLRIYDDFPMAL